MEMMRVTAKGEPTLCYTTPKTTLTEAEYYAEEFTSILLLFPWDVLSSRRHSEDYACSNVYFQKVHIQSVSS